MKIKYFIFILIHLGSAVDVASRILPAFNTSTGMPFGSINLRYGVAPDETPVTCTAAVGTYIVEFATISRLTGDMRFENAARRAIQGLVDHRSEIGLLGNHIDTSNGRWTGSGILFFFVEFRNRNYAFLRLKEQIFFFSISTKSRFMTKSALNLLTGRR